MKTLILDYLEETAARLPDKTAFADPDTSVTFAELERGARAVASALLTHVQPRTVLGFYMDKTVSALVRFMGAEHAGCAYAPLNLRSSRRCSPGARSCAWRICSRMRSTTPLSPPSVAA